MAADTVLSETRLLSVREAAARLEISFRSAYDLIQRGEFPVPVHRLGRTMKIKSAELERYLAGEQ